MQKFSQEQLMQYLYAEASPILQLAIDTAMKDDVHLQKEIKTLQRTIKQLNNLEKQSPSQKSIDAILNYARQTQKKNNFGNFAHVLVYSQ
ncbi:MAG: hypothetical protein QM541_07645 [Flavobacterium sp.]|nr:hypothetical protein [Flavobacterium sp.]